MTKRTLITTLAILLCVLLAAPAPFAQQAPKRPVRIGGDLETFRQELGGYYRDLQEIVSALAQYEFAQKKMSSPGADLVAQIEKELKAINEMSVLQLFELRMRYGSAKEFARLRESTRQLKDVLQGEEAGSVYSRVDEFARIASKRRESTAKAQKKDPVVNAIIPDSCPGAATPSQADIAITKSAHLVAVAALEAAPHDTLSVLVRVALVATFSATGAAVIAVETLYQQQQDCDEDTFRTLSVRLQIEANLGSTASAVGLFQIPDANGGHLDTAVSIITDLIAKNNAVGQPTYNAQADLNTANSLISQNRYKEAYESLRSAYRNLINVVIDR